VETSAEPTVLTEGLTKRLGAFTAVGRGIRGIVLKGTGLADLWPDVWPLVAFGAVIFTLAVLRFRQSLD
jgi:hypothetical protein